MIHRVPAEKALALRPVIEEFQVSGVVLKTEMNHVIILSQMMRGESY